MDDRENDRVSLFEKPTGEQSDVLQGTLPPRSRQAVDPPERRQGQVQLSGGVVKICLLLEENLEP